VAVLVDPSSSLTDGVAHPEGVPTVRPIPSMPLPLPPSPAGSSAGRLCAALLEMRRFSAPAAVAQIVHC
jgi:hypothetical protein